MYCIRTPHTKAIRKALLKYGTIKIDTYDIVGTLSFTTVRVYNLHWEVEIEFKGKAAFKVGLNKKEFYDSSLMKRNVSKVRINRILKRYMQKEIDMRLRYFGGRLVSYYDIKKIKWV